MIRFFSPKNEFSGPIMPKWLLQRKEISLGAKMLYAVLASCAYNGKDHCWPSHAYLSNALSVSVRSIQNYLKELSNAGLLYIDKEQGCSSKYYFVLSEIVELRSKTHQSGETTAGKTIVPTYANFSPTPANNSSTYANLAYINSLNNYKENTTLPPSNPALQKENPPSLFQSGGGEFSEALKSAEDGFATVWSLCPRKESKKAAFKAWNQAWFQGLLPPLETLLSIIETKKANDSSWLRGYAPYLVSWIRDARWQDEEVQAQQEVLSTAARSVEEEHRILERMKQRSREENRFFLKNQMNKEATV